VSGKWKPVITSVIEKITKYRSFELHRHLLTMLICSQHRRNYSVIVSEALSFSLLLFPKGWLSHIFSQEKRKKVSDGREKHR
jgi:hypothetical protein